jgi:hypothetical protein
MFSFSLTIFHPWGRPVPIAGVTYYVAPPFLMSDDGPAQPEGMECTSASAAIVHAEGVVKGRIDLNSQKSGCLHDILSALRLMYRYSCFQQPAQPGDAS